ncbi:MAG: polysaccharide biosynthesis/export family protein, partial [Planctomycetota bacterium]
MRNYCIIIVIIVAFISVSCGCAYAPIPKDFKSVLYRLSPGDFIEVMVQPNKALCQKLRLLPDGSVNYPLLGELQLSGKTVYQAEEIMEERMIKVLGPGSSVTIVVTETKGQYVYVFGEVNKPGRYLYNCNMRVLDAITTAGSYNSSRASLRYTQVTRSKEKEKPQIIRTNINSVFDGDSSQNMRLLPGDIVYIPPNLLTRVGDTVAYVLT